MSNFLPKAILAVRMKTEIKLCPFKYTPHALRTDGIIDLARLGQNWFYMQKFGRCEAKKWQDAHVQLDFKDLAQLRNKTTTPFRDQMKDSVTSS